MTGPRVLAIVPSAGCGKRMGPGTKKPFVMLGGKPLVSYALTALERCSAVDAIMVAAEKGREEEVLAIARRFKVRKLSGVVTGGKTRYDSVRNCVGAIRGIFDVVIIHDAARPLVEDRLIRDSVKAAGRFGACVAAVPESDTVKFSDSGRFVRRTLDRKKIFRAQTPQAFKYRVIKKIYSGARPPAVTDDVSLAERLGYKVRLFGGSYRNIKVTTPEDLKIAEAFL